MELTTGYHEVVVEARQAMRRKIDELVPGDFQTARQLHTIALVGAFADYISRAVARRDVVSIINDQLRDVGLALVETPRN